MAQALLIKAETAKDDLQYIGDIVGIFSDDHVFSSDELKLFGVVKIKGSAEEVRAKIVQITPRVKFAYLWSSDGKHHWETPGDPDVNPFTPVVVYQLEGDAKWYVMENDFKYPVNLDGLTPEEKQLLETVDINDLSVNTFVRKIVKDVTALPKNNVEIKELKSVGH